MVRFKVSTDTGEKYSQPTIWVGVNPGKLAGAQTEEATEEILALLKQHDITDVDVAYQEFLIMRDGFGEGSSSYIAAS
ncbi:hypothetical protein ONZ45_g18802 [Pleurotus djamor]|nr:hypothetical protein ONZ45_g18802 [Pleurotus djamor]